MKQREVSVELKEIEARVKDAEAVIERCTKIATDGKAEIEKLTSLIDMKVYTYRCNKNGCARECIGRPCEFQFEASVRYSIVEWTCPLDLGNKRCFLVRVDDE